MEMGLGVWSIQERKKDGKKDQQKIFQFVKINLRPSLITTSDHLLSLEVYPSNVILYSKHICYVNFLLISTISSSAEHTFHSYDSNITAWYILKHTTIKESIVLCNHCYEHKSLNISRRYQICCYQLPAATVRTSQFVGENDVAIDCRRISFISCDFPLKSTEFFLLISMEREQISDMS
jgi:hypothetical protein